MNSVFLVGRLGADPELRRTGAGKAVCNLRVATERGGAEGKTQEPDWHRVVVWDRQAETCAQYLQKGRMVAVSGRLQHRAWETDKGEKRYSTEVVAYRVQFFSSENVQDSPRAFSPPATQSLPF
jgi:single-strand DNA-binding protein